MGFIDELKQFAAKGNAVEGIQSAADLKKATAKIDELKKMVD